VTKTGATVGSFGVAYEATHNTATATWDPNNPGDFYRTTSSIYFAPTETSKTISIQTVDDGFDESNETLFLNLSGPDGRSHDLGCAGGSDDRRQRRPAAPAAARQHAADGGERHRLDAALLEQGVQRPGERHRRGRRSSADRRRG
jgi:hypothetical protein